MKLFDIDQQTCNRDGICAAVCPALIIDYPKRGYPAPVIGAEQACIRCGHCVAVCPTGSLSHRDMPAAHCPPVREDFQLSPEQCEHFLRSRRSIRTYKNKPVPRNLATRLIEIARHAPSGRNSQDARWLVLGSRDELHALASIVADWMRWTIASQLDAARSMVLDKALRRWELGTDIIFRDAPMLIVAHAHKDNPRAPTSCTIALTYLELAATSLGLGCCWAGYFRAAAMAYRPMIDALKLPEGHRCFGAVMVGYPRFRYHRLPLRNAPEITWRLSPAG
jgi:nitroreductase/NAD-dependent dihydropyrimidine dehydrogenase PreA subunit